VLYVFVYVDICWLIHVDSTLYLMIVQVLTEIKFIHLDHLDLSRKIPIVFPVRHQPPAVANVCQMYAAQKIFVSNLGTTTKSSGNI